MLWRALFNQKIFIVFLCFLRVPVCGSLFLTHEEQKHAARGAVPKSTLVLQGIYISCCSNPPYWVIWINDERIDSRQPRSIQDWTIAHVGTHEVRLRDIHGVRPDLILSVENSVQSGSIPEPPLVTPRAEP